MDGEHRGETTFPSNVQSVRHRIDLLGAGQGGTLELRVVDLGALPSPAFCFDAPATPCTPARALRAEIAGPGAVTLSSVRIQVPDPQAPAGFEVEPAVGPAGPPIVVPPGEAVDFQVRWCDEPGAQLQAGLAIDSDDIVEPTFQLLLGRLDTCPGGS